MPDLSYFIIKILINSIAYIVFNIFFILQAQTRRGYLRKKHSQNSESYLQWIFPEYGQKGPPGGLPNSGGPTGGLHPSKQCPV